MESRSNRTADSFEHVLLQQLRAGSSGVQARSRRDELARELAITDMTLADCLLELGIDADTAPAFEALPFVEVAWADGEVDAEERWEVLRLATAFGLELGLAAHAQLELWLRRRPGPGLLAAWDRFAVHAISRPRARLRGQRVLDGAREVASTTGGLFGLGTVSAAEREVLTRIEALLQMPAPDASA